MDKSLYDLKYWNKVATSSSSKQPKKPKNRKLDENWPNLVEDLLFANGWNTRKHISKQQIYS